VITACLPQYYWSIYFGSFVCDGGRLRCDICLTFLFKFSKLFLYLFFSARPILFSNKKPKPTSSSPISASHEPGVNGVTSAARPMIINMTPMVFFRIFFRIGFICDFLCVLPFWVFLLPCPSFFLRLVQPVA
jgi:hypothetical protein